MVGDMKDLEPKDISNITKITKISSKDLRKIQIILEKFVMALADSIKSRTIEQQFADILFDHFVGVNRDQCIRVWCEFMEGNVIGRDHLKTIHKHLAEYPMYIGRFLENTPPANDYRKKLIDTIDGCKNLINNVNEILRRVQDLQIHNQYSMKIEKCINSEKYSHYFPANIDFKSEKISCYIP
ncbi:hypothetical protein MXB_1923, partial [Myxobolus squamalis]